MSTALYSGDELREMLVVGAGICGPSTLQAAVHLLTFTELPARRGFAELLEFEDADGPATPAEVADRRLGLAAFVTDWTALPSSPVAHRLGSGDARLLALAVSLAENQPVDLRTNITVGGHVHARRVIEAMAIATGYGEHYQITPTAALDELLAARDALTG